MEKYMTHQRQVLLDFLKSHPDQKLSAMHIADELKPCGISVSAVYRNLAALEKSGEIKKIASETGKEMFYRYAESHGECKDSIHLSCKKCGKMFHLKHDVSAELVKTLSDDQNFTVDKSQTVLYGICGNCK